MGASQAFKFAILEHSEQFPLEFEGQLSDFIQKKCAAVCNLETTDVFGMGTGEGPFLMAEQLALNEVCRQCGAIHLDQRLVFAQAQVVNGPGNQLLAGSRFAQDEDRGIAAGYLLDLIEHIFKAIALADNSLMVVFEFNLFLEIGPFRFQLFFERLYLCKGVFSGLSPFIRLFLCGNTIHCSLLNEFFKISFMRFGVSDVLNRQKDELRDGRFSI